jgi:hypothetical protein
MSHDCSHQPTVVVEVTRGNPDDSELAALIAVLSALATIRRQAPQQQDTAWRRPGQSYLSPGAWAAGSRTDRRTA